MPVPLIHAYHRQLARDRGNSQLCRNSSALIDGVLLIDPGPDIFDLDAHLPDRVTDVLLTHTHVDHCSMDSLHRLCAARSVSLWAHPSTARLFAEASVPRLIFCPVKPFSSVSVGAYTVASVPSNHRTENEDETMSIT